MPSPQKNPRRVLAGQIGAARRWGEGPPRVIRLNDMTASQRRLVLDLVETLREFNDMIDEAGTEGGAHP